MGSNVKSDTALVAIDFHGDQIVTFQQNGEPYVAMRRVVENLGLNWAGQHAKLSDQGEKFACMDIHTHDTLGRPTEMLAMPVAKLPLWLASINPNKIPNEAKRAKIELYQSESAIALHDYWTKGMAIRGDLDGVVTSIDPAAMKALGGMFKAIMTKALTDIRAELEDGSLLGTQASVSRGMTAGEVVEAAGLRNRKGLRGIPRRVSDRLRRYHAERSVPVKIGRLGPSTAYVFDGSTVREWLNEGGGKQFIMRLADEKRGQGALRLIEP